MMTVIGTILIVLATIGIGLLVDRKWPLLARKQPAPLLPPPAPGHAPGEAPATALSATELERVRHARCPACEGPTEPLSDDHVRYDGRDLLVVHSRCPRCDRTRATYVRPA